MVTHPAREAEVADTTDDAGKARARGKVRHAGMVVAMVTGKARETIKVMVKVAMARATVDKVVRVAVRARPTTVVGRVAMAIKARDSKAAIRVAVDNNAVKVVADATVNSKVMAVVVKAATRTSSADTRVGTTLLVPLLTWLLNLYQEWMFLAKTSCWLLPLQPLLR